MKSCWPRGTKHPAHSNHEANLAALLQVRGTGAPLATHDSYLGVGPSSDCWHHSAGVTVPTGAWHCAEWQFHGPSDTMRFWLDGDAIDSLTVMGSGEGCGANTNEWIAPSFEYPEIGWESYQEDEARTLYIDDVVLSTAPIGCP